MIKGTKLIIDKHSLQGAQGMNTTFESVMDLYHDFCIKNNLKPYSLSGLANKLNISLQRLELTLEAMILYYPDRLKEKHLQN